MASGYCTNSKASSKLIFITPKRPNTHILLRVCHTALLLHKKTGISVVFNYSLYLEYFCKVVNMKQTDGDPCIKEKTLAPP